MPDMLILGEGGSLNADEVVAVTPYKSKPIRLTLAATPPERIINMTYGYPRESVILLKMGFYLIVNRTVAELTRALHEGGSRDEFKPPWW